MKLKSIIGVTLAVTMTAGLWFWFAQRQPVAKLVAPVIAQAAAPSPKLFPSNPVRMTVVKKKQSQTVLSPPSSADWTVIQMIVNDRAGYRDRLDAIASLPRHLTIADWAVLKKFLLKPDALDQGQLGQVIKNQLLDALCAFHPPPAGLGDVLDKMYQSPQQDEVIRDYAVQHLGAYYEQMTVQPDNTKTEQALQNTRNVLWDAINETDDSIGGTALLSLKRLSQEYPGFDQGKIADAALQMANDNSAGELSHITAYQVCAQLGAADALPVVLQAAQNGETISVRMSAIGALGSLGGIDQIPFLNGVLQGNEERLKPAAQHALEQITLRQTQLASQK